MWLAAIEMDAPRRIATFAMRLEKVLSVNVIGAFRDGNVIFPRHDIESHTT